MMKLCRGTSCNEGDCYHVHGCVPLTFKSFNMVSTSFKSALSATAITILLCGCQKETSSPSSDLDPELQNLKNNGSKKNSGRILFVSNRDGNDEIYSMDADGADIIRL